MVLMDSFANMAMAPVLLLSFPKRVFHYESVCLGIGLFRAYSIVVNR